MDSKHRDGRFAWAHDPFPTDRYPLAVLTSNDGITFRDMRAVHGEVPRQRYAGQDKNIGPQYVRGISFWNSDGSRTTQPCGWPTASTRRTSGSVEFRCRFAPRRAALWRTGLPIFLRAESWPVGTRTAQNGPPLPLRNPARVSQTACDWRITIRTTTLWRPAQFPIAAKVTATFELMATHSGGKTFEIELWSEFGDIRPVRIILQADGDIDAVTTKDRRVHVGNYAADHWMTFKIEADAFEKAFTLTLDGTTVATDFPLAENTASFQRLIFRTGEYRSLPIRGNEVPPGTDKPTASAEYFLRSVAIQTR